MRINIININEKSIFYLFNNKSGEKYYYIGINPYIIFLKPILSIIILFLKNGGRIHKIDELRDDLNFVGGDKRFFTNNQFHNSIRSHYISMYGLDTNKMQYGDYSYAYYHLTDLYLYKIVQDIKEFEDLLNVYDISNLLGFNYEYKRISEWLNSPICSKLKFNRSNKLFLPKIINIISVLLRSIFYITTKTRLFSINVQKISFAVDMNIGQEEDDDDTYIVKHIVDNHKELLFVFRNKSELVSSNNQFKHYQKCTLSDGRIYFHKAVKLIYILSKDAIQLFTISHKYNIFHFNRIINLFYQKARLYVFFEKFDVKCFWGRDDYNTIHTLRTMELRNRGKKSIGILHGLTVVNPRPSRTYIDYDLYYVFGEKIKKYYLNTWPKKMKVKAIGCWKYRPEYYRPNKNIEKQKNIIYYQSITYLDDLIMYEIIKLAKHFDNRKIIIKPKYNGKRKELFDNYIKKYDNLPTNIQINYDNSYQVMSEASYCVTLFSTIGAECLQFDLIPFWLDIDKDITTHYYREFPNLCVKNGEEIIKRIELIENGSYVFEKDKYLGLINFKEENYIKTIKSDISNFMK